MQLLIVGCGYLGQRVADRLPHVAALTRSPVRAHQFAERGWQPIIGDVLDPDLKFPATDAVVYAVGFDRSAGRDMRSVYVQGLLNVLSKLGTTERFVYVSSTGVYSQTDGSEVDEDSPTEPTDESGRIVLEAEQRLMEVRPSAIRLRFAGIYGPNRSLRSEALSRGEPIPGDPEAFLNLIHVDDGASAVLAAIERAKPGRLYNVCDNQPVRRREYFWELAARLGAPPVRFDPSLPSRGRHTNRQVLNRRLREELGVSLAYPNYRKGLDAILPVPDGAGSLQPPAAGVQ